MSQLLDVRPLGRTCQISLKEKANLELSNQTLTFLYHLTHPRLAILKETSLSISVFSIASFISMVSLLLQLHLTRANDPPVPLFLIAKQCWEYVKIGVGMVGIGARARWVFQGPSEQTSCIIHKYGHIFFRCALDFNYQVKPPVPKQHTGQQYPLQYTVVKQTKQQTPLPWK